MINKKKLVIPAKQVRDNYLKKMKRKTMEAHIKKVSKLIDICFSKNIFAHHTIQKLKLKMNMYMVITYLVNQHYSVDSMEVFDYAEIRSIIRNMHTEAKKKKIPGNTTKATLETLKKMFVKYHRQLKQKRKALSEEKDEESEEEEGEETEDEEDDILDEYFKERLRKKRRRDKTSSKLKDIYEDYKLWLIDTYEDEQKVRMVVFRKYLIDRGYKHNKKQGKMMGLVLK